jgi:hypothetical protein
MKRVLILALTLLAASATAQSTGYMVPVWNGRYVWLNIGPTLIIKDGMLDVATAAPAKPTRLYGVALVRDATGAFTIPAAGTAVPSNVEIWVNGIHYWPVTDYSISGRVVTPTPPATNWPTGADVRASYDP